MQTYSSPSQISIPTNLSLTQLLHSSHTPLPPSHIIASDSLNHRSLTLHELRTNAGRIASSLSQLLSPPDQSHFSVILPNSCDYIEIVHAVLWLGGVVCPINHAIVAHEIAHGLSVTRPSYIIAYGPVISKIEEAIVIATRLLKDQKVHWPTPKIITIISPSTSTTTYPHIPQLPSASPLPIPTYQNTKTRLATLHLSSGTTGPPKAVRLTHYNFLSNTLQLSTHVPFQFSSSSRIIAYTPFAHIGNTTFPFFLGPYIGMHHHCMPVYSLSNFGPLVDSVKPTIFQGVPSVVVSFANTDVCDKYDFSSADKIDCGGMPFSPQVLNTLSKKANWRINQVYGMTEAAGYVAYQSLTSPSPSNAVGPLLPNIEAVLRIENGKKDAPLGGPGELWIRGPNITTGYAWNEAADGDAFPCGDGWYNTGDVCTINDQGIVSVVGRTKDLIKYKGFQVSPTELEALISAHPSVLEAAVGAVYDESQLTELPTAYVVLKSHLVDEKDVSDVLSAIQRHVDGKVSGYKKLRGGVWQIGAVPKGTTGKVVRGELWARRTGAGSLKQEVRRAKL
ncbi:AMP-binding enzyme [Dendryphion nanum]|uniref:AMP-binding enzyme n=1 Tax=Dendryphion nanum TaxID=256645 RepID=A0A9P9DIN1_9PLEO|nr:AMP-binding enzyme [Dendryphion nanum]